MPRKYKDTIDWDRFWESETVSENMLKGGRNMAGRLARFIEQYGLGRIADFGCGPGITLFILAEKYPECEFVGFDPSMPVIEKNRARAENFGLSNMRFEQEMLPRIRTNEKFDMVYCIAPLHYVKDIRGAIRNLYARANDSGFLIFNYPNRFSLHAYRNQIRPDDAEGQKRFSLVLNEKNLLTLKDIESVLGRRPGNFWKAVDEGSSRENNCVYVRREATAGAK
jgi:trans-aconitate methyltransferase